MLVIDDEFKQSRMYKSIEQEIKLTAKLEAQLEAVPRLLALGLSVEQIAQALDLTLEQLREAVS
ncbi:MAG: hypothetical protein HC903_03620 [Methylacidiphilales bacterium]|nr:hypothetical protein [Candidatus Methylacidiphilales bacterium]NJR18886.1 hypothetical protein [Calothrix sp. CSU_2_0]